MKAERSKVDFPLWRKKVDGSLFHYKGTSIPTWACSMWGIQEQFCECRSKKHLDSKVKIVFNRTEYDGWITIAPEGRKTPNYRLWFSDDLLFKIKDVFLMSFMRDLEYRLLKDKSVDIEGEIPFWEFLDIEYDKESRIFYFTAHYTQKPSFPELFKRLIGSPTLHKIDDELEGKGEFRIYKQNWKPRQELESELGADNVLYTLIDTENKLIYVGEAGNLVKRLLQPHPTIPHWNYFRYDVLPEQLSKHRVLFERMLIRDFASLLHNKKDVPYISISEYKLSNDKIDK